MGEAIAFWNGTSHQPLPSEAGHADFAPRNELEAELLLYLRSEHGRVSYERVISGPGLQAIYRFLRDKDLASEHPEVLAAADAGAQPAIIAQKALSLDCPLCVQALDIFVSCLGAEAGNLALRSLTIGGIYLGGGIAPKIIEKLKDPTFLLAFLDKGRLRPLLESIPIHVILNDRTALQGAARRALQNE
jgi:glucokinase